MIARLRGKRAGLSAAGLVLDVNGVGYLVQATPSVLRRDGDELTVETYLHVREDALQLYGFGSVPGIGKKTAQRVVLELKEKLGTGVEVPAPVTDLVARDALVELGYSVPDAERALAGVDPELSPEQRVREALRRAA
jgi:Holliday junction DNA helicase RuvA